MPKNRVKTNSRLLADIMLSPRSRAYKELCASAEENGIQSDAAAEKIRDDLTAVVVELLKGNYGPVNAKLDAHPREASRFKVLPIGASKIRMVDSINARFTEIRIAKGRAYFVDEQPDGATAEQVVYGLLRRSLENGDIERLAVCEQCGKIFYRKSLKRNFCSNACRWMFHNRLKGIKEHEKYGKWYHPKKGD